MGDSTVLSAALTLPPTSELADPLQQPVPEDTRTSFPQDVDAPLDQRRVLFCEFFAGRGALTAAVSAAGVPTREADEVTSGGVDFAQEAEVTALMKELQALAASGLVSSSSKSASLLLPSSPCSRLPSRTSSTS